jgi:hypothetical protein
VIDDLVGWLAVLLVPNFGARSERRRNEAAWAEGRQVVFEGWVLGERPYCRKPGGAFVATASSLGWQSHPDWHAGRHALPVERLRVLRVRARQRADIKQLPWSWSVAECADGEDRILIACSRDNMRYIQSVLEREHA